MRASQLLVLSAIFALLIPFPAVQAAYPWSTGTGLRSAALGGVTSTGFAESSSILANPAALTKLEQSEMQLCLGTHIIDSSFNPDNGWSSAESDFEPYLVPFAGYVLNFGSRLFSMALSVSTFENYTVKFPVNGIQRYQLTEMKMLTGAFDVALAFVPTQELSFGVKVGYLAGTTKWSRAVSPFGSDPSGSGDMDYLETLEFETEADLNLSAGMIWSPIYRFELGLTYQPPLAYHYDPEISVSLPEAMGNTKITRGLKKERITIPQTASLGIHWIAGERMDLYLDAVWTQYSDFELFRLDVERVYPPFIQRRYEYSVDFDDEWRIHAGCEVVASDLMTVRLGAYYSSAVSSSEELSTVIFPTGEDFGVTLGMGMTFNRIIIDVAGGFFNNA